LTSEGISLFMFLFIPSLILVNNKIYLSVS
jgi:hypothetical protein